MANQDAQLQALLQKLVFTQQLLSQQREWMQSVLNNSNAEGSSRRGDQVMCPAFHNFNKENQNWESYLQQIAQHFTAYAVETEEKKNTHFLSWVGSVLFELLKKLFGTNDLSGYTYKQLTEKLTEHVQSKRHVVAAGYEFLKCEMRHNKNHREWVADLCGIARECPFVCGASNCTTNFVDEMIRDQVIVHTPYDSVRSAAVQKLKPSLEDVLIIAETLRQQQKPCQY